MPVLLSPEWWSALLAIVLIDLVLAGDNAIVIGLAARHVPRAMQRRVILWGTVGAIAVRVALTAAVVSLLKIPGFLLIGGVALVWIAWKLTRDADGDNAHGIKPAASVRAAVQTIIIADAVMGIDNVLAVGGAAQGSMLLVLIGLAVSVPIVVGGSTLVVKWVERFPAIMWIGAGVLGWTAAKMIAAEPLLSQWLDALPHARTLLQVALATVLVVIPLWRTLSHEWRALAAVLVLLCAWLAVFGWVEDRAGVHFDVLEHWRWDDELVDLVRWVGWIAPAIALHRLFVRREGALATRS